MDKPIVAVYLDELAFLSRLMTLQAERPRQAATDWGPVFSGTAASIRRIMDGDGTADTPEYRATLMEALSYQDSVLVALDGFLAAWARASLMLWPAPIGSEEHKAAAGARGQILRQMLRIKDSDNYRLENRTLRDNWMHYDERLDDVLLEHGASIVGTDFVSPLLPHPGFIMRAFDLPSLTVTFAGGPGTKLDELFEVAEDLGRRVDHAKCEYFALGGSGISLPTIVIGQ